MGHLFSALTHSHDFFWPEDHQHKCAQTIVIYGYHVYEIFVWSKTLAGSFKDLLVVQLERVQQVWNPRDVFWQICITEETVCGKIHQRGVDGLANLECQDLLGNGLYCGAAAGHSDWYLEDFWFLSLSFKICFVLGQSSSFPDNQLQHGLCNCSHI